MIIEISDLQFKPIKDQVDNDEFNVEFFIHFSEDNLLRFEGSCSLEEKILMEKTLTMEKDFNQLDWVKIMKEYYKDHSPNQKYGSGGVTVTVLMELEQFVQWLSKKGYLK